MPVRLNIEYENVLFNKYNSVSDSCETTIYVSNHSEIRTQRHSHTRAHTHTHTHTHTQNTHIHTYTHTHIYIYIYTQIRLHVG